MRCSHTGKFSDVPCIPLPLFRGTVDVDSRDLTRRLHGFPEDCIYPLLEVQYDAATGNFSNVPGVSTSISNLGGQLCAPIPYEPLFIAAQAIGYTIGENLCLSSLCCSDAVASFPACIRLSAGQLSVSIPYKPLSGHGCTIGDPDSLCEHHHVISDGGGQLCLLLPCEPWFIAAQTISHTIIEPVSARQDC